MDTQTQEQPRRPTGAVFVVAASFFAGAVGYLTLWVTAKQLPIESYGVFVVFWSGLYFLVGSLSGVQQEIARATVPLSSQTAPGEPPETSIRPFMFSAAFAATLILAVTSLLWGRATFPEDTAAFTVPLLIGVFFYVLVAAIAGTYYGIELWKIAAAMIATDAVLRAIGFGIGLYASPNPVVLAWMTVLPFVIVSAVMLLTIFRTAANSSRVTEVRRRLTINVSKTLVGTTATALLISGFPFFLKTIAQDFSALELAPINLVLTLTRSPITIPFLALQSVLVVRFRSQLAHIFGGVLKLSLLISAGVVVLGVIAYFCGGQAVQLLFGESYVIANSTIAWILISSGLIALMCVSGAACLALDRHNTFMAGWVVAALLTVAVLFIPVEVDQRVVFALMIGPAVGLMVHLGALSGVPKHVEVAQ